MGLGASIALLCDVIFMADTASMPTRTCASASSPAAAAPRSGRWCSAPLALRYTKLALNPWIKSVANVAFDVATALEIVAFQSEGQREALATIREKRKSVFKGR